MAASDGEVKAVPLDLSRTLPDRGRYRRLSLRIENLPHGASLSQGRDNGDRTWSLKSDELEGLVYFPPAGEVTPHTLRLRVIGWNGDDATTVAVHDLVVTRDGARPEQPDLKGTEKTEESARPETDGAAVAVAQPELDAQMAALSERLQAAEARAQKAEGALKEASVRRAAAEARAVQAEAAEKKARSDAAAEAEGRIQRLRDELAAAAEALSAHEAGVEATCREIERRLQAEHARTLAEALATQANEWERQAAAETARLGSGIEARIAAARAAWERELEPRLAQARAEADHRDRHTQAEAAPAAPTQVWDAAEWARLAAARSETKRKAPLVRTKAVAAKVNRVRRRARLTRGLVRAGALAACIATAVVLYPHVAPLVARDWEPRLALIGAKAVSLGADALSFGRSMIAKPSQAGPPPAVIRPAAANLRAGPSAVAAVIATVRRGTRLQPLEVRGDWVLVRLGGETAMKGWVHASLLARQRTR